MSTRPYNLQQVGIFGLGVAGLAMARMLLKHAAKLTLVDENPAIRDALSAEFIGQTMVLGAVNADVFLHCTLVVCSPGIHPDHAALRFARSQNCPVVGEVELIKEMAPTARTLAITGTNGKSTTTSLAGSLLRAMGQHVFVGGNLGEAIGDWLRMPTDVQPPNAVLELSSYQIDGRVHYQPDVAVVLNVTPDHMARYGTMQAYVSAKARLVSAVNLSGTAVLNADDPHTLAMAPLCAGEVAYFSARGKLPEALGKDAAGLVLRQDTAIAVGHWQQMMPSMLLQHDALIGPHNKENALAALLGCLAFVRHSAISLDAAALKDVLGAAYRGFSGLPHRLALAGEVKAVRYLNDSKATNDASAATAVLAMTTPYILLVGGQDKGGGYAALTEALRLRPAKAIIAFGAARGILHEALREVCGPVVVLETLEEACVEAQKASAPNDTVLLSPACTSFDAFTNYQHRGDVFTAWVHAQQRT